MGMNFCFLYPYFPWISFRSDPFPASFIYVYPLIFFIFFYNNFSVYFSLTFCFHSLAFLKVFVIISHFFLIAIYHSFIPQSLLFLLLLFTLFAWLFLFCFVFSSHLLFLSPIFFFLSPIYSISYLLFLSPIYSISNLLFPVFFSIPYISIFLLLVLIIFPICLVSIFLPSFLFSLISRLLLLNISISFVFLEREELYLSDWYMFVQEWWKC